MKPMRKEGWVCWGVGITSGRKEVRMRVARLRRLTRSGRSVED